MPLAAVVVMLGGYVNKIRGSYKMYVKSFVLYTGGGNLFSTANFDL